MPNLGHGVFVAPYHPLDENPTMCIHRDFELMEWLDKLGFDEAWIGEHHSAGFETICSPELFIAAAAERRAPISAATRMVSVPAAFAGAGARRGGACSPMACSHSE